MVVELKFDCEIKQPLKSFSLPNDSAIKKDLKCTDCTDNP